MARKAKKQVARRVATVLPKKMSKLIEIALKDLRKMEELPDEFVVNMSNWFYRAEATCNLDDGTVFKRHEVCVACLAGGVMAFTLKAKGKQPKYEYNELTPDDFPKNAAQLTSLDCLREGDVTEAAEVLGLIPLGSTYNEPDPENKIEKAVRKVHNAYSSIPDYERDNPEPFHRAMNKLAANLKRNGL